MQSDAGLTDQIPFFSRRTGPPELPGGCDPSIAEIYGVWASFKAALGEAGVRGAPDASDVLLSRS